MVKYNEEIYNINKKAVDEELKLLQESVNNTEISENDKLAIYNRINAKTLEAYAMTQKHQSDINKLNYDIFKTQADEQIAGIVEFENNKKEVIIGTEQQTQIELAKQYVEGNITFEEYQKGIVEAADKSKLEQQNIAKDMAVNLSAEAFTEAELLKQQFGEDSQYYIDAYKRYQESLTAVSEAETNVRIEKAKQEIQQKNETKKHNEDIVKSYQAMAKSVGGIMGTVSDIMEDNIDQKVKNGEISEEQAKEEFERVKKLQIGETIVNTITGAVGAFMQDKKSYPAPYNYIIAGIDMASTLATGIAQINQIKSQEYGSSSSSVSGGSVSNSGVSVMPLLDENQDVGQLSSLQTANNTGTQTDNRVYILQSDITDSNNQVDIRENNTTY